ncbi:RcnB family protein [Caulobacter sp. 1776]|uniref:RcnB family protein n=1 Tax=Caulobacter sp. 1776 TaxID=3156420 RepID=UPI003392F11D
MKRFLTASVAVLMLSGAAAGASAQDWRNDHRNDGRGSAYDQVRRDQDRLADRREARYDRRDDRREAREDRREYRRWVKGQRLDARYRGNGYYVSDYRRHGLRAPPRGYRWHRVDNQYVLAAVATGLIASVILANH